MQTYLDCFPCFLHQALRAGRMATDDPYKVKQVLDEVGRMLGSIPMQSPPPRTGALIYQKVSQVTGLITEQTHGRMGDRLVEGSLSVLPRPA